ncbi:hypothetical protein C8R44DRAFT_736156 [Mycena epipterygia]|nr:hypothetical protein C8R44DRAFT_736156 [Mycena epipterygia]
MSRPNVRFSQEEILITSDQILSILSPSGIRTATSLNGKSRSELINLLAANVARRNDQARDLETYRENGQRKDLWTLQAVWAVTHYRVLQIEQALHHMDANKLDVFYTADPAEPDANSSTIDTDDKQLWPSQFEGFWNAVGDMSEEWEASFG